MAGKAKVFQTVTRTKTRVKKDGSASGDYQQCRICGGSGIQKIPRKKK